MSQILFPSKSQYSTFHYLILLIIFLLLAAELIKNKEYAKLVYIPVIALLLQIIICKIFKCFGISLIYGIFIGALAFIALKEDDKDVYDYICLSIGLFLTALFVVFFLLSFYLPYRSSANIRQPNSAYTGVPTKARRTVFRRSSVFRTGKHNYWKEEMLNETSALAHILAIGVGILLAIPKF